MFFPEGLLSNSPAQAIGMLTGAQEVGKFEEEKVPRRDTGQGRGDAALLCPCLFLGGRPLQKAAPLAQGFVQTCQCHVHKNHGTEATGQGFCY